MTDMRVRPVAAGETEEFLDWFERYWVELETFNDFPDPLSRDEYRRMMRESDDHHFWWLDDDGAHVGFCVFSIGHHWYRHDLTDGYVDEFYIDPEARRSGAGHMLAAAMLDEFHRRGVRQITLSVLLRNTPAATFWQSLGFVPSMYKMTMPQEG